MKFLILIACLTVTVFANSKHPKYRHFVEVAKKVNSENLSWKASTNYDMALEVHDLFTLHGACKHEKSGKLKVKKYTEEQYGDLPKNFDAREKWANCKSIGHIRDQSSCGSCWAFGAVEAMTDRICAKSNGNSKPILSTAHLTACDRADHGCNGGRLESAYNYYTEEGLVTGGDYKSKDGCWTYPFPQCEHHINKTTYPPYLYPTPECVSKCREDYKTPFEDDKHFGEEGYAVQGVKDIQKDIYENGPVSATFTVYSDLLGYQSGVYKRTTGSWLGGHAVKIIGWGAEDGEDYWLVANSWNADWGDKGFFKIARGQSECDIEDNIVASLPKSK